MSFRTVLGTCHHDCPDSCGWVATVDNGAPAGPVVVKLRGNPEHPYSRGELCPKINRFLERVYAPDRLLTPLIRTGAKGLGAFRSASWEEALDVVHERTSAVIAAHGGQAVVPWVSAGTQGMIQQSSLDRWFFDALGASYTTGSLCGSTAGAGVALTYGSGRTAEPAQIEHAKLILLWGTNTRLTNRHLWPFIEQARANGAVVWVVDPVRTETAQSADRHVQPRTGSDVALMLSLIHVLVRDDLIDHDYVTAHAEGFDALACSAAAWPPTRAAAECGIDAAVIEELAAAYGSTKYSFIRTLIGGEHHGNGAMFFRTLACLPVLTGAWRVLGGGLARSTGSWMSTVVDDVALAPDRRQDSRRPLPIAQIGRWLNDPESNVRAIFIWNGNPVVSAPDAAAVRRGLGRDDLFCVVSEQFMTDTARFADVVLPAATQLEVLDVVPAWGHMNLGWNEPAIAPLGESVANTELWRRMAKRFGLVDVVFDLDDLELIRRGLRDDVGLDLDVLQSQGYHRLPLPNEFLVYPTGGFAGPNAKAALANQHLGSIGVPAVPEYTPSVIDSGHLFALLSLKTAPRFLNSSYGLHHEAMVEAPSVEMHPDDVLRLGLAVGEVALVFNERAFLQLPVSVGNRVRRNEVAVPWGHWGEAANVNALTSDALTDLGGGVAYYSTRVSVVRAA